MRKEWIYQTIVKPYFEFTYDKDTEEWTMDIDVYGLIDAIYEYAFKE